MVAKPFAGRIHLMEKPGQPFAKSAMNLTHLKRQTGRYGDSVICWEISGFSMIFSKTYIYISESANGHKIDPSIHVAHQTLKQKFAPLVGHRIEILWLVLSSRVLIVIGLLLDTLVSQCSLTITVTDQ